MKDFLAFVIVGLILWFFSIWVSQINAKEALPQEFVMKTEVGEIVLTSQACSPELAKSLYYYYAYASEPGFIHPGCWKIVEAVVHIYFPEIDTTAVYKKDLFGPRQQITPNV
tara:strand:- start:156 stop:491 length:336 start_codon:yes stop_codon:yes gene_type:complete